jgi:hypothetical protein
MPKSPKIPTAPFSLPNRQTSSDHRPNSRQQPDGNRSAMTRAERRAARMERQRARLVADTDAWLAELCTRPSYGARLREAAMDPEDAKRMRHALAFAREHFPEIFDGLTGPTPNEVHHG